MANQIPPLSLRWRGHSVSAESFTGGRVYEPDSTATSAAARMNECTACGLGHTERTRSPKAEPQNPRAQHCHPLPLPPLPTHMTNCIRCKSAHRRLHNTPKCVYIYCMYFLCTCVCTALLCMFVCVCVITRDGHTSSTID